MNDLRNEGQLHCVRRNIGSKVVDLLKACAKQKDFGKASKLHAYIRDHKFLETDSFIASALVSMYARCGALEKAQRVLDELPGRDVVSWTALIAGYAQYGQGHNALKCFDSMQNEGFSPNEITLMCALKACGSIRAIERGEKIHGKIVSLGLLEKNIVLGNTLIDMYARCGALVKAQQLLDELQVRNVITWNALIGGYNQQGQCELALRYFDSMQHEGHLPDTVSCICALKACGSIGAACKGEEIHEKLVSQGTLAKNIMLGNTLVDMYAKCGALTKAEQVLHELPVRNVVTWNALIAGYAQEENGQEALKCFDSMQSEGHCPDAVTFICALKACGNIKAGAKGEQIHDQIISVGLLNKTILIGSTLVDMYARCGALAKARQVLDKLPVRNMVMWTSLISGYAQQGHAEEALKGFESMQSEGHTPDMVTFVCALRACGSMGMLTKGEHIHEMIVNLGMLENNIVLGSALLDMYAKCGALAKAQQLHDELPVRDLIMWTALIAGYAQEGQGEEALKCFDGMQYEGYSPNVVTLVCALKACASIGSVVKGEEIHDKLLSLGLLGKDVVLGTMLVDVYARCGALAKAEEVLKEFPVRDVTMWNALIGGYSQHGHGEEALKCFDNMICEGHSPDSITFVCVLKACGIIGAITRGRNIHDDIACSGLLEKDIVLGNALVDMYAKCGAPAKAQDVLVKLPFRDVISWTSIIAGYSKLGQAEEALNCFDNMQQDGHSPNVITCVCALRACGSLGTVAKGEWIHDDIINLGFLDKDTVLGSTLVDMYARCAALTKAVQVFESLPARDVIVWTALIGGYAQQGESEKALSCFKKMQSKGVRPDSAVLACVLNVCNHSGLLDQAEIIFLQMISVYDSAPGADHYCCLVDLFSRAGEFNKALVVIETMPLADYSPIWLSLLGSCGKWGDLKIGTLAFEYVSHLDTIDAGAYVCMSNIYACRVAGMQEIADN